MSGKRVQATVVAFGNDAVFIRGAAGSGKSGLALEMMALGAKLVGDDGVDLQTRDGVIVARPVPATAGLIEARYLGILKVPYAGAAHVRYIVDMDAASEKRLPELQIETLMGVEVPVIYGKNTPNLPAALLALLSGGLVT